MLHIIKVGTHQLRSLQDTILGTDVHRLLLSPPLEIKGCQVANHGQWQYGTGYAVSVNELILCTLDIHLGRTPRKWVHYIYNIIVEEIFH